MVQNISEAVYKKASGVGKSGRIRVIVHPHLHRKWKEDKYLGMANSEGKGANPPGGSQRTKRVEKNETPR